jgi:leader peptidase (prepilin peptidase)/N-methyltransferase
MPPPPAPIDATLGLGTAPALVAVAFVTGTLVGSFLNVVAHRVPRGRSFVGGRSHCPACGTTVRARDNVPILGWILLRGRCRDCGWRIPPRYPLVEAACGIGLAALAVTVGTAPAAARFTLWLDRSAILLTLTAWMLLALDGHVVRSSTAAAAAVMAAVAATTCPGAAPLGAAVDGTPWPGGPSWVAAITASALGAAAGWLGGRAMAGPPGRNAGLVVGSALGWQAVALALAATLALRGVVPRRAATVGLLTAVAHGLLIVWPTVERAWLAGWAMLFGR